MSAFAFAALVWAGLGIGGTLIAASAKFQVAALPLDVALQIGRVTFRWVGAAEAVAPLGTFALQWLALMPTLDARTLAIIGGEAVAPSRIHLAYVALEAIKVAALMVAGTLAMGERHVAAPAS